MAEMAMLATAALAAVNAALALGLLAVYLKSFTKTRAPFTVGLILFALFFLAHNVLSVYAYISMMELVPSALAPYMLVIMAFEAVGLGVMLVSSWK